MYLYIIILYYIAFGLLHFDQEYQTMWKVVESFRNPCLHLKKRNRKLFYLLPFWSFPNSFEDRFLRPDNSYEVVGELTRLSEQRSSAGLGTGATSDKAQNWVSLHMSIADKRILKSVAGKYQM